MAKCVNSTIDIPIPDTGEDDDVIDFDAGDVKSGENFLNERLEEISEICLSVAHDFSLIKLSTTGNVDRWDSIQVQESLTNKLKKVFAKMIGLIRKFISSNLLPATKQRFFIVFTSGAINKLKRMLQIVGRLSELDQTFIYLEEQRKPLISEESATIHSLTCIWSATLKMMTKLKELSSDVFKEEEDDCNFVETLDVYTSPQLYAEIFFMDMTITSWIQFNRLVKYDDLINSLPFLCPCHAKVYFITLNLASKNKKNPRVLSEILPLMLDHQSKPSVMTQSTKNFDIVPYEPCYAMSDRVDLAYFIIWHLYSLSHKASHSINPFLPDCYGILETCLKIALSQFVPTTRDLSTQEFRLSPHKEERFKLLIAMINRWCEKNHPSERIIKQLFLFFNNNLTAFEENYYDNPNFRVDGLTVFQLFTKMIQQVSPLYTTDGQAVPRDEKQLTRDQKSLLDAWDSLLARNNPQPSASINSL